MWSKWPPLHRYRGPSEVIESKSSRYIIRHLVAVALVLRALPLNNLLCARST